MTRTVFAHLALGALLAAAAVPPGPGAAPAQPIPAVAPPPAPTAARTPPAPSITPSQIYGAFARAAGIARSLGVALPPWVDRLGRLLRQVRRPIRG